MPKRAIICAAVTVMLVPALAWAQPGGDALTRREIDARINAQLREVLVQGVNLFNPRDKGGQADQAGCFRLWQGSLITGGPLLNTRPDLRDKVQAELKSVDGVPSPAYNSI